MSALLSVADPSTAPGLVDTISSSTSNAGPVLITVAGLAIGIAAGPFVVKRGWGLIKSMRG